MVENVKVLYEEEKIQKRILELAQEIDKDYARQDSDNCLCVKRCCFFYCGFGEENENVN